MSRTRPFSDRAFILTSTEFESFLRRLDDATRHLPFKIGNFEYDDATLYVKTLSRVHNQ